MERPPRPGDRADAGHAGPVRQPAGPARVRHRLQPEGRKPDPGPGRRTRSGYSGGRTGSKWRLNIMQSNGIPDQRYTIAWRGGRGGATFQRLDPAPRDKSRSYALNVPRVGSSATVAGARHGEPELRSAAVEFIK